MARCARSFAGKRRERRFSVSSLRCPLHPNFPYCQHRLRLLCSAAQGDPLMLVRNSFALSLLICCGAVACSTEDNPDAGEADSGIHPDAAPFDTGPIPPPRDSGPRDATTPPDAGHYCTENNEIAVGNTDVTVAASSMAAAVAGGG